jgi:predicted dehydrogenase
VDLIKAAVIGAGFVGPHHVDAVRRGGYGDVVVLADIDAAKAQTKAGLLRVERWTGDVDSVLGDPEIDVIHVCTPNVSHAELAIRALRAGKHVVVDKPLACRGDEADAMVAAARQTNRHAAVSFVYRGYPMIRRARDLVLSDALGELRLIHGTYLQDWLSTETDYSWRVDSAVAGPSRVVADIGSHWFDTVEYIVGQRVRSVFASLACFLPVRMRPEIETEAFGGGSGPTQAIRVGNEDAATMLLRLEGGAVGAVVLSQVSPGHKNDFRFDIAGSHRTLAWQQESPEVLLLAGRNETQVLQRETQAVPNQPGVPGLPAGHVMGYASAFRDVLRPFYAMVAARKEPPSLEGGFAPYPTFADGARAVHFADAVLESARCERWVSLAPVS